MAYHADGTFWCKMATRTIQTIRTRKTNKGSYRPRKFKVANFRKTTAEQTRSLVPQHERVRFFHRALTEERTRYT